MIAKRMLAVACAAACVLLAACSPRPEAVGGGLRVYAGFYAVWDFTRAVSGGAEPGLIVPKDADPHEWEPSPREMAAMERADVIVYGAGMGHFIDELRKVCERAAFIDATAGLPTEEDPHVWLNPIYAKQMLNTIADGLAGADAANAALYAENYAAAAAKMDQLDKDFAAGLSEQREGDDPAPRMLVVDHAAFGHLCARYGLTQVALSGTEEDAEPTPARMAEVLDLMAATPRCRHAFAEPGRAGALARLAREAGAEVGVLDPFELQTNKGDDYWIVMYRNLEALKALMTE